MGFGYHGYRLTQTFAIPDTELLVLDFEGGATAHLSISWAADLAIYDRKANDRERININFVVTSERYLLRFETREGRDRCSVPRATARCGSTPSRLSRSRCTTATSRTSRPASPLESSAQEAYRDLELTLYATAHPTARPVPVAASAAP